MWTSTAFDLRSLFRLVVCLEGDLTLQLSMYLPGWTEEVFVICRVQQAPVHSSKVEEMYGTPLEGTLYEQGLQKVTVDDDSLFRIEEVLKGSKDNNWIHKRDVQAWATMKWFYPPMPKEESFPIITPTTLKSSFPTPCTFREVAGKWDWPVFSYQTPKWTCEPCGMPNSTVAMCDFPSSICTICLRSVRKSTIHSKNSLEKPRLCILVRTDLNWTVSNALL